MNKILSFVAPICVGMLTASCGGGEQPPTEDPSAAAEDGTVTPSRIGVTDIEENFTAYPNCDGMECFSLSFTVGVQVPGSEDSPTARIWERESAGQAGVTRTSEELTELRATHETLRTIDPALVRVIADGDRIMQIAVVEQWGEDGAFVPGKVLWEHPSLR
jgi:hypothetical protein